MCRMAILAYLDMKTSQGNGITAPIVWKEKHQDKSCFTQSGGRSVEGWSADFG